MKTIQNDQVIYKNLRILIIRGSFSHEVVKTGEIFDTMDQAKLHIDDVHSGKFQIPKTVEGYDVIRVKPYDVVTSVYMKTKFDDDVREKGFSGVVKDPNIDDRFICYEFCIWNANGDLIHSKGEWGQFKRYKIQDVNFNL